MNLIAYLSSLGIRQRVMILALLPVTLVALVISGYMITTQLEDERRALFEDSQTLARYLATGAEFAFFTNSSGGLKSLARGLHDQPEISNILFVHGRSGLLYESNPGRNDSALLTGAGPGGGAPLALGEGIWAFHAPVFGTALAIEDFEETNRPPQHLGTVYLVVNETPLQARQRQIFLRGLLITLVGLTLTLLLAVAIGRSIFNPIQAIIDAVNQLGNDRLNVRVAGRSSGEIGELERGINSLAERVQHTRERLQDEVGLATAELQQTLTRVERQNQALNQARDRAETANRAKDAFLARMSHELRTPLTSVLGFVRLLRRTNLDREQEEFSTIIQRTSTLLLSLIDDILDFSKLQSDAIHLESIPFNLEDCIEDILEMQSPIARDKQIDILFISDPALPEKIQGDPTRISQVVANLISNAVKFTEQGAVQIRLRRALEGERPLLEILVEDSGVGIDAEQLRQLFQPFTQADTSITRRFGGSGLGLVITKRLVEMMAGEITMASEVGQGTRVKVRLPLDGLPQDAGDRQSLGHLRVLVYDTDPASLEGTLALLTRWECELVSVRSVEQLKARLCDPQRFDHLIIGLSGDALEAECAAQRLTPVRRLFHRELLLITGTDRREGSPEVKTVLERLAPLTEIHRPLTARKLYPLLASADRPLEMPTLEHYQPLEGVRILVAEDNRFNRLLLQKMLEQFGAVPTLANNGQEALDRAALQPFDAILMDVHMPVLDGIEASRRIRQLEGPSGRTPIIALTANVVSNEEDELRRAGVDRILFKPINEQLMVSRILEVAVPRVPVEEEAPADNPLRLADYGITKHSLHDELHTQVEAIHQAFLENRTETMRDHSHQLLGLAGLLELVELEAATFEFNRAVKTAGTREIWEYLWRLERVIAGIAPR